MAGEREIKKVQRCINCVHLKDIDYDTGRDYVCTKLNFPQDEPYEVVECNNFRQIN